MKIVTEQGNTMINPLIFVRLILCLMATVVLSGCWKSEEDLFSKQHMSYELNTKIMTSLPTTILVEWNGQSLVLTQTVNDLGEPIPGQYKGNGFDLVRFAKLTMPQKKYIVVQFQRQNESTYFYSFFKTESFILPGIYKPTGASFFMLAPFANWEDAIPAKFLYVVTDGIRKVKYRKSDFTMEVSERVKVTSLGNRSEKAVSVFLDQADTELAAGRYERAAKREFIKSCNDSRVLLGSNPIDAMIADYSVRGETCIIDSMMAEVTLGLRSIENLQCDGVSGQVSCSLDLRFYCRMETRIANNTQLNQQICGAIEAIKQPVRAKFTDDGRELQVIEYRLLQ